MNKITMKLNIRVAGKAGLGMNSTADIIADVFAHLGYDILTDIEYQSVIKGGINYFDINIWDGYQALSKYVDILIALDDKNLKTNREALKKGKKSFIITSKKNWEKIESLWVDYSEYNILPVLCEGKYDNTYLISVLVKLLWLPKEVIEEKIEVIFARKGEEVVSKNKTIFNEIFENYHIEAENIFPQIKNKKVKKEVSYGNKIVADGAMDTHLGYYSAYPMTPASTILSEVVKAKRVTYFQAEDEIAVINSALGASFTGTRAMVGTSGGGFALMTEAISFAIQAELPITIALSQRAGPSTGTPTFWEQGDLNFALNPSFGDFDHIVIAPSRLEDGYLRAGQALNLAEKYQTVVILLIDKYFSDGKASMQADFEKAEYERGKFLWEAWEDYKRYALTDDGISPMIEIGKPWWEFIATSYEHDEYGATTEDSEMKKKMTEKRWKKLEKFFEKEGIKGYELINENAKKMLITTSFISYSAREFVKNNPEYGLTIIHFLKPLDMRLLDELKGKEEVIFVEYNYSGQLENYIVKELWLKFITGLKISHMRKYDLLPFYYEDFEERLK